MHTATLLSFTVLLAVAGGEALGPVRTCRCYENAHARPVVSKAINSAALGPARLCHCYDASYRTSSSHMAHPAPKSIVHPVTKLASLFRRSSVQPVSPHTPRWTTRAPLHVGHPFIPTLSRWTTCPDGPAMTIKFSPDNHATMYLCNGLTATENTFGAIKTVPVSDNAGCNSILFEVGNSAYYEQASIAVVYTSNGKTYVAAGYDAPQPGENFRVPAYAQWRAGTCANYENDFGGTDAKAKFSAIQYSQGYQTLYNEYGAVPFTANVGPAGPGYVLCALVQNQACIDFPPTGTTAGTEGGGEEGHARSTKVW